ncbi:MAG: non-heme iron oxygenase ferredoxin subunit [Pseudoxanthomonas sp.]
MSPASNENATWTFICATGELLPGEFKSAFDEVTGAGIVVFNLDGELYALEDRCSHEEFELSAGNFDTEEGSIECILHGARFDVRDGRALCAPAYEPAVKFPVKTEHGGVWSRDDRD